MALLVVAGSVEPVRGERPAALDRPIAEWQRDLRGRSADVRVAAARTLTRFGEAAVPSLSPALGDSELAFASPDPRVRANAAVVLGSFGPPARQVAPALGKLLHDPHARVREWPARPSTVSVVPASLMKCH